MLTQEERALLVEVQDRLLELYVHREQASKTRDWKRVDSLDADIAAADVLRRRPFEQRDQRHALFGAATAFARGDDFFRIVDDQYRPVPARIRLDGAQKKPAQQRREPREFAGRSGLRKVRALDTIEDREPLEELVLHLSRTEAQTVADVIEEQPLAVGEQAAREKAFERQPGASAVFGHRKDIVDVAVQDEDGRHPGVPASGEFQSPAAERSACRYLSVTQAEFRG